MPLRSSHEEFVAYWGTVKPLLDEGCRRWVQALSGDLEADQLEEIHRTLEAGKRLRGGLVCLMSEALGGKIEAAIPRAVAVEGIQTASLIHDDFVDQDFTRRHKPATWTLMGARRAVLLGDLIFSRMICTLMELSREDGQVITEAIGTMAQGVYQEPLDAPALARAITNGTYRPELYQRIIHLKTGALFGTASKLGALAAGAAAETLQRAFWFGLLVGETYQLADDLQEVLHFPANADGEPSRMVSLAPVILYFCRHQAGPVARVMVDGHQGDEAWIACMLEEVGSRLREETQRRAELALATIKHFPDTPPVRLLRALPFEAARMQDPSGSEP